MNKEIQVIVEAPTNSYMGDCEANAILYQENGALCLRFPESGSVLHHCYDDEDGCPVFGWYGINYPGYAIYYPDGQEGWTTQSIYDELNGVPLEDEPRKVEITFTFVSEEKVGDISVTEALQVSQVIHA